MPAFEDFVTTELPRRSTVLLSSEVGYTGNPNGSVLPALNLAPGGRTYFFDESSNELWFKQAASATSWVSTEATPIGNPAYKTAGTYNLFVDQTGDDNNDGQSVGTPFLTLERVIDEIPLDVETGVNFQVEVRGTGFTYPNTSRVPNGVSINFVHRDPAPLLAVGAGAATFVAPFADSRFQYQSTLAGMPAVAVDGGAYAKFDAFDSFFAVREGPAGTLNLVADRSVAGANPTFGLAFSVFGFTGTVNCAGRVFTGPTPSAAFGAKSIKWQGFSFINCGGAAFIQTQFEGCKFDASATDTSINSCTFRACAFPGSPTATRRLNVNDKSAETRTLIQNSIVRTRLVLSGDVQVSGVLSVPGGTAIQTFAFSVSIEIAGADVEHCGDLIQIGGDTSVAFTKSCSFGQSTVGTVLANNVQSVLNVSASESFQLKTLSVAAGQLLTGTTQLDCFEFVNGSQGLGIQAACNGNLASATGFEVIVGALGGNAFAALPLTDATQLVRVQ